MDRAASVRVQVDDVLGLASAVLRAVGAPPKSAAIQAYWLVQADCRGHRSHGLQRLPLLVRRVQEHLIAPNVHPLLEWRRDGLLAVDGRGGFGPVTALAALEEACQGVSKAGVVLVAVSNANHLGMLAPYLEWLTSRSLLGVAFTTSEALVHPYGGRRAMVGTNPIAIGVPARPVPLIVDLATGEVSMGKIIHYRELGIALEPGWALDATGTPTTDPAAAVEGAIAPFGGAKGFALGLAIEVLVASVTAAALGREVRGTLDADSVCNKGDVFICVDPAGLVDVVATLDRVSQYLADVRAQQAQEGFERVRLPGERSATALAESAVMGVEIAARAWDAANELASELNVTPESRCSSDLHAHLADLFTSRSTQLFSH